MKIYKNLEDFLKEKGITKEKLNNRKTNYFNEFKENLIEDVLEDINFKIEEIHIEGEEYPMYFLNFRNINKEK